MRRHVLVVDDDPLARALLARALESGGHTVAEHGGAFGTTARIQGEKPDVVVVDVNMPGLSGSQLVEMSGRRAQEGRADGSTLFILYSGMDKDELERLAVRVGAAGALAKSLAPRELLAEFERIVATRKLESSQSRGPR